ncbi:hypothetical protein [Bosea sp. (in: a-proteobacteria)]|uniref:hypothetical protein n=1 Tax=Bosea sp. (in: a-proteobacteria) TaxID=1871050 RepID=UPI002615F90A|nr:hypothetical protein [Bosea sp. (in: a-proteobacteria)]MCO5092184.1 hypothetical protein [Bosea sp. (in: a-proteobacteria)]
MPRLLAAALAATLALPAVAEPGSIPMASLPLGDLSAALAPRAVCALPAHPAAGAGPDAPPTGPAVTLSPRMLQAIRVEADRPAD